MNLSSIGKLASNKGKESVLRKSFEKDFRNDLMNLAVKEIIEKIIYSSTKTKPATIWRNGHLHIAATVTTKAIGNAIVQRIKNVSWLCSRTSSRTKRFFIESTLKGEAFKVQMLKLNEDQLKVATDVMKSLQIRTEILISTKASSLEKKASKNNFKRLSKSILKEYSFTPDDLGLKMNVKYSMKQLDIIVDHGISQHSNAIEIAKAILYLARNRSKRKMMVKSGLVVRDLNLIQKNFLIVAAAVSALHSNPKMKVMFHKNGFVLFLKDNPVGRFGKEIEKGGKTMRNLFKACRTECGAFPGKASAIMDVLDAEGKKKEHKLKELFNDFAKHMITNSSGPASKAAAKFKKTAQINERLNWNNFKKSFDTAAKHVKEIDFDPMVKDMAKTVRELNQGRNVLKMSSMRWTDIFRKKDLSWLGTLTADILEDEVNTKNQAVQALSCVANWMENNVTCNLNIKHVGSEGEMVVLTPCSVFKVHKWNIELQDIMKTGPKWKKV